MTKYKAKPDTWFDEGTEAVPVTDFWECYIKPGEFDCSYIGQPLNPEYIKTEAACFCGMKDGKSDEEICCVDEFEIEG